MQTCEKGKTASKPDTAKTNTNSVAAPADAHAEDNAPRISLADAKKAFDEGNVVFVDTRGEEFYKMEHVKGAINVPITAFDARFTEIPKGKKIIAYCS